MSETRISMKCIPYTKYFGSLFVFLYNFTLLPLCNAVQKPYNERVILLPIYVNLLNLFWLMTHLIDPIIVKKY